MGIFDFEEEEILGIVERVDTSTVRIQVKDDSKLVSLQVNHLIAIQSSRIGQYLVGLVAKIIRQDSNDDDADIDAATVFHNTIFANLIGTYFEKDGIEKDKFKRTLSSVPTIDAKCYLIAGERLKRFMQTISSTPVEGNVPRLELGTYSIDEEATAWLDGNRLFQRHAVIVGSTGSGKSWCVAKILEQVATLKSADAILFDIHGEYTPLIGDGFTHLKVAGPNDEAADNILFLPYWLLTYEEMISLMLDRSDTNAPNQAMLFSKNVIECKRAYLTDLQKADMAAVITLDSPVPYKLQDVMTKLQELDTQKVEGARGGERLGTYNGKLTRFIQRLEMKSGDKRLNFMFSGSEALLKYEYMEEICSKLMSPAKDGKNGVKIIDFSEVPSDILPLIVSLTARIIFSVQQWTQTASRHPIALFCDEAHLYIPATAEKSVDDSSVQTFERISKEGRKYGIGLVVITQRPSEVNRTVLSQCNNFVAMRLTNAEDQTVIRRLLPDALGNYAEALPVLDTGEALIVGDASLLPSRIKITPPKLQPRSATVDFWDKWARESAELHLSVVIEALRRQSK